MDDKDRIKKKKLLALLLAVFSSRVLLTTAQVTEEPEPEPNFGGEKTTMECLSPPLQILAGGSVDVEFDTAFEIFTSYGEDYG